MLCFKIRIQITVHILNTSKSVHTERKLQRVIVTQNMFAEVESTAGLYIVVLACCRWAE